MSLNYVHNTVVSPNSVMSIEAITTSPGPISETLKLRSRKSSVDTLASDNRSKSLEYQLPSLSEMSPQKWTKSSTSDMSSLKTIAGSHWTKNLVKKPTKNIDLEYSLNCSRRMRFASDSTLDSSVSDLSTFSNEESNRPSFPYCQPEPNFKVDSCSDHTSSWIASADSSLCMESSRSSSYDYCESQSSYMYNDHNGNLNKPGRKRDALATRRARNKLASAKYRAKKQALTHAMQDRIMQLATQVMNLRDELNKTKNREAEILGKYERLVKYYQNSNDSSHQPHAYHGDNGNNNTSFYVNSSNNNMLVKTTSSDMIMKENAATPSPSLLF